MTAADGKQRMTDVACKRSRQREDWDILITNIPAEKCGLDELVRQSLTKTELGKGGRIESAETDPGG
jgi:hypothetical protein